MEGQNTEAAAGANGAGPGRGGSEPVSAPTDNQKVIVPVPELTKTERDAFLPECIHNTVRLLDAMLHVNETTRLFIERRGIDALLKLYTLPRLPVSFGLSPIAHSMTLAFRAFSHAQHSLALSRAVCVALRERMHVTAELVSSVMTGHKISDIDESQRDSFARTLTSAENFLTLSANLVRTTTTMVTEISSAGPGLFEDIGVVYREMLWQIAVIGDARDAASADGSKPEGTGPEASSFPRLRGTGATSADAEASFAHLAGYMDGLTASNLPATTLSDFMFTAAEVSAATGRHSHRSLFGPGGPFSAIQRQAWMRSGLTSGAGRQEGFGPMAGAGPPMHLPGGSGRHGPGGAAAPSRQPFAEASANLAAAVAAAVNEPDNVSMNVDAPGASPPLEAVAARAVRPSPPILHDIVLKVASSIRQLCVALAKVMYVPSRRGQDVVTLPLPVKLVAGRLSELFRDTLTTDLTARASTVLKDAASSSSSSSTLSSSVRFSALRWRFLGKAADDMQIILFGVHSARACNTAILNAFFGLGAIHELLRCFKELSDLQLVLPPLPPSSSPHEEQGTSAPMDTEGGDAQASESGPKASATSSTAASASSALVPMGKGGESEAKRTEEKKAPGRPWVHESLKIFSTLLEQLVSAPVLLTPPNMAQLLVMPVTSATVTIPSEPQAFVRALQRAVLEAVLPLWRNPRFPECSPTFITAIASTMTNIYTGVGEGRSGARTLAADGAAAVVAAPAVRPPPPPLDETTVSFIVESGFPRQRAEEALRSVGANSVELAMEWLFSHPAVEEEEAEGEEDDELAQALALSMAGVEAAAEAGAGANLGGEGGAEAGEGAGAGAGSGEGAGVEPTSAADASGIEGGTREAGRSDEPMEEPKDEAKGGETVSEAEKEPDVEEILQTVMQLLERSDAVTFPLTDLLLTICSRNKGEERRAVISFFGGQLRRAGSENEQGKHALSAITHVLALMCLEDLSAREMVADEGIAPLLLANLERFVNQKELDAQTVPDAVAEAPKYVTASLLILDYLQGNRPLGQKDAAAATATQGEQPAGAGPPTSVVPPATGTPVAATEAQAQLSTLNGTPPVNSATPSTATPVPGAPDSALDVMLPDALAASPLLGGSDARAPAPSDAPPATPLASDAANGPRSQVGAASSSGAVASASAAVGESSQPSLAAATKDPLAEMMANFKGYLSDREQDISIKICVGLVKLKLPAVATQAVLQLCARLTKKHSIALRFLENGGLSGLLSLPKSSVFPGFDSLATSIIRHLLEDPTTLQTAMESEIKHTLSYMLGRQVNRTVAPSNFLTTMAPLISREPAIFMQAAMTVCQVELVNGRASVVLVRDKEKEKERERARLPIPPAGTAIAQAASEAAGTALAHTRTSGTSVAVPNPSQGQASPMFVDGNGNTAPIHAPSTTTASASTVLANNAPASRASTQAGAAFPAAPVSEGQTPGKTPAEVVVALKSARHHKRVPATFVQVLDELIGVMVRFVPAVDTDSTEIADGNGNSAMDLDVDKLPSKVMSAQGSETLQILRLPVSAIDKGKAKVGEVPPDAVKAEIKGLPARESMMSSAAKVAFVLRLMSEILLMYSAASAVVLRRDSEGQTASHGGLLHHVLHKFLPFAGERSSGERQRSSQEEKPFERLGERAAYFLVALCVRSGEGRRRAVAEMVKALRDSSAVASQPAGESSSSSTPQPRLKAPTQKVRTFVDLVNKNLQSHPPGIHPPGVASDMAQTMMDAGMVQALTQTLETLDLDHPDAPKLVTAVLKALEVLTRVTPTAETGDRVAVGLPRGPGQPGRRPPPAEPPPPRVGDGNRGTQAAQSDGSGAVRVLGGWSRADEVTLAAVQQAEGDREQNASERQAAAGDAGIDAEHAREEQEREEAERREEREVHEAMEHDHSEEEVRGAEQRLLEAVEIFPQGTNDPMFRHQLEIVMQLDEMEREIQEEQDEEADMDGDGGEGDDDDMPDDDEDDDDDHEDDEDEDDELGHHGGDHEGGDDDADPGSPNDSDGEDHEGEEEEGEEDEDEEDEEDGEDEEEEEEDADHPLDEDYDEEEAEEDEQEWEDPEMIEVRWRDNQTGVDRVQLVAGGNNGEAAGAVAFPVAVIQRGHGEGPIYLSSDEAFGAFRRTNAAGPGAARRAVGAGPYRGLMPPARHSPVPPASLSHPLLARPNAAGAWPGIPLPDPAWLGPPMTAGLPASGFPTRAEMQEMLAHGELAQLFLSESNLLPDSLADNIAQRLLPSGGQAEFGNDPAYMTWRTGRVDGRLSSWNDDGLPQSSTYATGLAQAMDSVFMAQMRTVSPLMQQQQQQLQQQQQQILEQQQQLNQQMSALERAHELREAQQRLLAAEREAQRQEENEQDAEGVPPQPAVAAALAAADAADAQQEALASSALPPNADDGPTSPLLSDPIDEDLISSFFADFPGVASTAPHSGPHSEAAASGAVPAPPAPTSASTVAPGVVPPVAESGQQPAVGSGAEEASSLNISDVPPEPSLPRALPGAQPGDVDMQENRTEGEATETAPGSGAELHGAGREAGEASRDSTGSAGASLGESLQGLEVATGITDGSDLASTMGDFIDVLNALAQQANQRRADADGDEHMANAEAPAAASMAELFPAFPEFPASLAGPQLSSVAAERPIAAPTENSTPVATTEAGPSAGPSTAPTATAPEGAAAPPPPSTSAAPLEAGEPANGPAATSEPAAAPAAAPPPAAPASASAEIDPTFLEALPADLRAEVLASQQQAAIAQQRRARQAPLQEDMGELDPEFLAALPPDIQAEVLAQQRAQRAMAAQAAVERQPVDMDSASIIATFPAELREEVLLTSSEAVLAAFPPALLAEAQLLRERAMHQYQARGGAYPGQRLGAHHRRVHVGGAAAGAAGGEGGPGGGAGAPVVDPRTGVVRGARFVHTAGGDVRIAVGGGGAGGSGSGNGSGSRGREADGKAMVDMEALRGLLRLLRLAQPLGKGLLQRLLLNLCSNSGTRYILLQLLLDILRPEVGEAMVASPSPSGTDGLALQRLYGCQWNVVYARPQASAGVPPLVSRRVLEILTYLARHHGQVAQLLVFLEPTDASLSLPAPPTSSGPLSPASKAKDKGKAKVSDVAVNGEASGLLNKENANTQKGHVPLILLLKLLDKPLYYRSSAHLEQAMSLMEVVVKCTSLEAAERRNRAKARLAARAAEAASAEAAAVANAATEARSAAAAASNVAAEAQAAAAAAANVAAEGRAAAAAAANVATEARAAATAASDVLTEERAAATPAAIVAAERRAAATAAANAAAEAGAAATSPAPSTQPTATPSSSTTPPPVTETPSQNPALQGEQIMVDSEATVDGRPVQDSALAEPTPPPAATPNSAEASGPHTALPMAEVQASHAVQESATSAVAPPADGAREVSATPRLSLAETLEIAAAAAAAEVSVAAPLSLAAAAEAAVQSSADSQQRRQQASGETEAMEEETRAVDAHTGPAPPGAPVASSHLPTAQTGATEATGAEVASASAAQTAAAPTVGGTSVANVGSANAGGAGSSQRAEAGSSGARREAADGGEEKEEELMGLKVLAELPQPELRTLCRSLSRECLSDAAYGRIANVIKLLAETVPAHRRLFIGVLAEVARELSAPAIAELSALGENDLVVDSSSMAGAATLRVLQTLSALLAAPSGRDKEDFPAGCNDREEALSVAAELNAALEPLWQGLSACSSRFEGRLSSSAAFTASSAAQTVAQGPAVGAAIAPLPPGIQKLVPFVESFFVLWDRMRASQPEAASVDSAAESRACRSPSVNDGAGPSSSVMTSQLSSNSSGSGPLFPAAGTSASSAASVMTLTRFAEKHRRLLNAVIRQNAGLLEASMAMLLRTPKLLDFDNKRTYFRSRIKHQHEQQPHYGTLRVSVRRAYVLEDSYNQLRMRTPQELKGRLTVQFQGEEGIDAGGLTREWYQLLSRVVFDKGALLFTTVGNDSTFQPNPNSVLQTEHLSYFKFVGRVVAKALFDGQLLDVYFTRSFYKHILGSKVTYHDIEAIDPDYYKNLKWMLENDISDILDLTFSMDADEEKHILYEKGEVTDYELIPGGRTVRVTEENKEEYVNLVAEYRMTVAIRPQINAFLEGFTELIDRNLVSIFNDKELELLISGLPEIDIEDLRHNTEYTGLTASSPVSQWFWEVVRQFSIEDKARLLQFITGTSKVPLEGFRALQGISGLQRFQIHRSYGSGERLPTAHTCFNQLDLPEYTSKEQLRERLLLAIHEGSEGFGFG
eukprot:TRINITY_DN1063_c0_g2_i1.p1 TRINITY_DN1063_c0_g2~~TRINITY_DN1063_c0_g2_i1.p1  ORF type:complete len:4539 (-),score=961.90 TRINITY_DN1063_c0_g2_i1:519-13235(-)